MVQRPDAFSKMGKVVDLKPGFRLRRFTLIKALLMILTGWVIAAALHTAIVADCAAKLRCLDVNSGN